MKNTPTQEFYNLFQYIYNYFNKRLFENELPSCMLAITRNKGTFGYFAHQRWINKEKLRTDEIAINPTFFAEYPVMEILQTMVHEMCHLWQYHFGKPSRRTYHNKEWGDKMQLIGLMPSNTGQPGGKQTGQQMMEYIIEGGIFETVANKLVEENAFKNLWYDRQRFSGIDTGNVPEEIADSMIIPEPGNKKTKIKYSCTGCGTNVWGKASIFILCGTCGTAFEENQ